MAIDRHAGTNAVDAGASRRPMSVDGRLFALVGQSLTTTGTAEELLKTFTIPRNTLNSDRKVLRVRLMLITAANNNAKAVGIRVTNAAGTLLWASGSHTTNAGSIYADVAIMRIGANNYEVFGRSSGVPAAPVAGTQSQLYTAGISNLLGNGFILAITGTTAAGAGDVTLKAAFVDLMTEGGQ